MKVFDPERVIAARRLVQAVYTDERIKEYVLDLVGATRRPQDAGLPDLAPLIEYGASPRAAIYLLRAAKAHALLRGARTSRRTTSRRWASTCSATGSS